MVHRLPDDPFSVTMMCLMIKWTGRHSSATTLTSYYLPSSMTMRRDRWQMMFQTGSRAVKSGVMEMVIVMPNVNCSSGWERRF